MDELIIRQLLGMHHQRRAAVTNQLLNRLTLFLFVVVAIADQQKIAGVVGDLLHGFHHRAEKGI